MLLVSILLLGAGGALIMTTMMSANNLSARPRSSRLITLPSQACNRLSTCCAVFTLVTSTDRMSCTAIIPDISNGPANDGALRLAGWLPYNDRFDEDSLVPVTVGAITGGYRVTVEDMDPNSHIVSFTTSGVITGSNAGTPDQKTFGTVGGTDEVTVRFSPQGSTTLTPDPHTFPLTLDSALGSFVMNVRRPAPPTTSRSPRLLLTSPFLRRFPGLPKQSSKEVSKAKWTRLRQP